MKRKGIGYMIEVIVALITLVVFVLSVSIPQQNLDWNRFQKKLETKDMALTLKKTGDASKWIKYRNTGNFKTFSKLTTGLETGGSLHNFPPTQQKIGVTTLPNNRNTVNVKQVTSTDYCYGDLEEIKTEEPVLRTENQKHDTHLYFGDTDPQISGGGNGIQDYDTLYVDNKTRCQFSSSEGPYYTEEIFGWGNQTLNYYDFKNITDTEFRFYEADLTHKISTQVNQPVNGIPVQQNFDKIELENYRLSNYNLIILKKPGTIQRLNNKPGLRDKVFNYLKESPILIISDLDSTTVSGSFIQGIGLTSVKNYESFNDSFNDGKISDLWNTYGEVNEDGGELNISNPGDCSYDNATVDLGDRNGDITLKQDWRINITGWYEIPKYQVLENGNIEFSEKYPKGKNLEDSGSYTDTISVNGNTKIRFTVTPSNQCGNPDHYRTDLYLNQINISFTPDYLTNKQPRFTTHRYSQRLQTLFKAQKGSENINNAAIPNTGGIDSNRTGQPLKGRNTLESQNTVYTGNPNNHLELVNIRKSFPNIVRGDKLARIDHTTNFNNKNNLKILSATIYWLLDKPISFGSTRNSKTSATILGSIDDETYMPYKLNIRWYER